MHDDGALEVDGYVHRAICMCVVGATPHGVEDQEEDQYDGESLDVPTPCAVAPRLAHLGYAWAGGWLLITWTRI